MVTPELSMQLVEMINDNWKNSAIGAQAIPVWMVEFQECGLNFQQLVGGLRKMMRTEQFRPSINQIIEASRPRDSHIVVTELSDEFPLTERTAGGDIEIVGYINLVTREVRSLPVPDKPKQIAYSTPLEISAY